jgi:UDP-4-amino-4-deoxy-L-arabinose-oxoglutarate aminotransferase
MIPHSRPFIDEVDIDAVISRLRSGMLNEGEATQRLEHEVCRRFDLGWATATGSGSQALLLALRAVGVCTAGEVILPAYVCPEVLGVVETLGARGVIVDVDEDYLLSEKAAIEALTPRTQAIVFVHALGIWRDAEPLAQLGVPLVEDWAQWLPSCGPAPVAGSAAVLSFEATKLITGGEGGMVIGRDVQVGAAVRAQKCLEGNGAKLNLYPLSDLQAILVESQFERLEVFLGRRRELAFRYFEGLADVAGLGLPFAVREQSIFFRFPLRIGSREPTTLIERFAEQGVAVRRPVDRLLHRVRADSWPRPVAERLFAETLSLPLYPCLRDAECDLVIDVVHRVFSKRTTKG